MFTKIQKWWRGAYVFHAASPERVKSYALARASQLSHSPKFISDHVTAMGKWLLASLLLLNGGAALATLNAAAHVDDPTRPALLFLSGVFLALINGWLIQVASLRQMPLILRSHTYWSMVANDGWQSPDEEEELWSLGRKAMREAVAVQIPGWFSAGAFAYGYLSLMSAYHAGT